MGTEDREAPPDALTYWGKRDRWAALGKRIGALRAEARCLGLPLEDVPGARAAIAEFKALGKELDRRAR